MSSTRVESRRETALVAWGSVLLLIGGSLWIVSQMTLNRDVGWWLYVAESWLGGARLYVDIWEVNPPLMAYLAAVPQAAAALVDVSVVWTFRLFIFVLVGISLALSLRIFRLSSSCRRPEPALVALLAAVFLLLPLWEFGQREHIMMVLVCPYVFLSWARMRRVAVPRTTSLAVGGVAAAGFALKPHFVLLWLAIEGLWLLRRERSGPWLRPETIVVGSALVAYVLWIGLVHPAYLDLGVRFYDLYGSYRSAELTDMLRLTYLLPVLGAAAATILVPHPAELRMLGRTFLVFGLAALVSALIQGKGFSYHFYPVDAASTITIGVAFVALFLPSGGRDRVPPLRLFGAAAAALALLLGLASHGAAWRGDPLLSEKVSVAECGHEDAVLVMSGQMADGFPFVTYSGCTWAAPVPFLWPVQAVYAERGGAGKTIAFHPPEEMGPAERSFFEAVVKDFVDHLPKVIFVQAGPDPSLGGARFAYMDYFAQDPAFAEARRDYARQGRCGSFRVYVRRDAEHRVNIEEPALTEEAARRQARLCTTQ